jgi:ABC-type antimicrobial peptide transport system permease subunit
MNYFSTKEFIQLTLFEKIIVLFFSILLGVGFVFLLAMLINKAFCALFDFEYNVYNNIWIMLAWFLLMRTIKTIKDKKNEKHIRRYYQEDIEIKP